MYRYQAWYLYILHNNTMQDTQQYYNYKEHVTDDILDYLNENYKREGKELTDDEKQELYDKLRIEDSVTWNASGSYTFNSEQAKENIRWNIELLVDTIEEYEIDRRKHYIDREYLDVSIRCYLLRNCLNDALELRYWQRYGTEEERYGRADQSQEYEESIVEEETKQELEELKNDIRDEDREIMQKSASEFYINNPTD